MTDGARYALDAENESSGLIGSLPIILWQRRWLVILPALVIAIAGIAAAFLLPRTYRSSAVLLVESQNLPGGQGGANDDSPIDRRMAKIRQQILSRPDLVELIQTNDLYDASRHAKPLSELVEKMRDATQISAVDADIQRGAGGQTNPGSIAFSLSFAYPQPAQAQLVAQTFVDRLLKLDASQSQTEAQNNVHFLEDQEAGLQQQEAAIDSQVNHITGVNGAALSSATTGSLMLNGATDYAGQIASLQRENAQLQSQQGSASVGRDPSVIAAESALAAARAEYSDSHPDVKLAESRLAAAKANATSFQSNTVSGVVQRQIQVNNEAIGQLQRARGAEQSRTAALAAAQARGPMVAQQVQQLQGRGDSVRQNLAKVQASLLQARSMVKLADQQRGERLTLIDPPVTPDTPTSPNRVALIAGGILGGIAVGIGLALLLEMINRPIRSVAALTGITGEPPLAVVPTLSRKLSKASRRARRRREREALEVA